MKTIILTFKPHGTGRCLYTDAIPLHSLGRLRIRRFTRIEFNETTQQWEVHDLNNQVLHMSDSRAACLDWEQDHFNARM